MSFLKRTYTSLSGRLRTLHYKILSDATYRGIAPHRIQPILFRGKGVIDFQGKCVFGWFLSPGYHNTYAYIEAREVESTIIFGGGSYFNNNLQVIADRGEIRLGNNLRIGINCMIVNGDFHNLDLARRDEPPFPTGDVVLEDNVFIGNNVTILKSVRIGKNSTIGSGSVVTGDIPANCIAAGIPAKVLKQI